MIDTLQDLTSAVRDLKQRIDTFQVEIERLMKFCLILRQEAINISGGSHGCDDHLVYGLRAKFIDPPVRPPPPHHSEEARLDSNIW